MLSVRLLERLWSPRRGYRPDWRDGPLLDGIAARSSDFADYRRRNASLGTEALLAGFFRARTSPRFFAETAELSSAAARLRRRHPVWAARTLELARKRSREGLDIYAGSGPPLGTAFPWRRPLERSADDKLYRKRPHRFAFAPGLALAALYGEPAAATLREVLSGWMSMAGSRDNGLAFDSNLGVIQRLLALTWSWAFLAARPAPTVEDMSLEASILKVVHGDLAFLAPRLGDSFANNHLLADAFAGWFAGLFWPELCPSAEETCARFEPVWLRELARQILADGTSFEHSMHYHEYACEMASAYVLLSRRNGRQVPEWVLDRTRRMLEFQASVAGPEGETLAVGDAAEDPLFPLDAGDGWGTAAWRELHCALFEPTFAPASVDAPSRERAHWLSGGELPESSAEIRDESGLISYTNGGFYVFRDVPRECRLTFRTGPVEGEAVSAGHAHSDLLSVCLSARGRSFLTDPGTYTYRALRGTNEAGEPDWRRYFRGPAAHNGLHVEGRDALGDVAGDFRPPALHTFVSVEKVRQTAVASWVEGRVVGRGPYASHRRGVVHLPGEYFLVYDVLPEEARDESCELRFQFSPGIEAHLRGARGVEAESEAGVVVVVGSNGVDPPGVLFGSREPIGGWVSRRYGDLTPAPQARFRVTPAATTTAILLSAAHRAESLEVELEPLGESALKLVISSEGVEDTLLLNLGASPIVVEDLVLEGELAWLRSRAGTPRVLRWLESRHLVWPSRGIAIEHDTILPALEVVSDGEPPTVRHGDPAAISIQWKR